MAEETKQIPGNEPGTEPKVQPPSFDEVLQNKDYQSEFDRRVNKAIETAKGGWDAELETIVQNRVAEAERQAKMTAEEKAEEAAKKREADYAKRVAAVTARELKAEAREQLAAEGFPQSLADVLNYADADACKASLEAVKQAFSGAVEQSVNDKLRGSTPKSGTPQKDLDSMSDEEYYNTFYKKE